MNPRLSTEWLGPRHRRCSRRCRWLALETRPIDEDGGFGPWKPEYGLFRRWSRCALLVLVGAMAMGWGKPHQVEKWMPRNGRLEYFDDLGHFIT